MIGGWLGWETNYNGFSEVIADVFDIVESSVQSSYDTVRVDGADKSVSSSSFVASDLVRGFATDTSGYQPLGSISSTDDPCGYSSNYNDCINEVIYISTLSDNLKQYMTFNHDIGFVTDTSRNGVEDARDNCEAWCNIEGSGLGERPTSDTSGVTGTNDIDAFFWVKIPGESDGMFVITKKYAFFFVLNSFFGKN